MAAIVAVAFTSCDKDADNVKLVTVSGTYGGDIVAELYMPDYDVEQYYLYLNENGETYIASDTIKGGEVELHFASDDNAHFGFNHLSGINFKVQYAFVSEEDDYALLNPLYEGGSLAKLFYMVKNHYLNGNLTKEDFYSFAKNIEYIEDNITIHDFSVQPFKMREKGAMYSTYDFEQNSVYVRTTINPFKFSRKTNISDALQFAEEKLSSHLSSEEKTLLANLKAGTKLEGTISGAGGWTSMGYSNYKPNLDFTIDEAPGLLDVLSKGLFGEYKLDDNGNIQKDSEGNPVPRKSLVLDVFYEGTIANMNSYERVEK